jgi:hypothetical protein
MNRPNTLAESPAMNPDDLDAAYTALSEALARVGEKRAPLFLSTLALALVARQPDAAAVLPLIDQAERLSLT